MGPRFSTTKSRPTFSPGPASSPTASVVSAVTSSSLAAVARFAGAAADFFQEQARIAFRGEAQIELGQGGQAMVRGFQVRDFFRQLVGHDPQVLVVELAFCHREMVRLMHRTAHQEADKAEAPNMLDFLRIGGADRE